jgi:phosphopantetheinyl transferase
LPLVLKDFNTLGYSLGIWEIIEDESFFVKRLNLSDKDKELLKNAKNNQRRLEILSVRLLLKSLGINLDISHSDTGKPIVQSGNISISHTKRYSALVYHPQKKVCVDIEKISNIVSKSKHLAFSKSEIEFAGIDLELLTTMWCCKECVVKLTNNIRINFTEQIYVHPFKENSIIQCDYTNYRTTSHLFFNYLTIKDHVIVWGG